MLTDEEQDETVSPEPMDILITGPSFDDVNYWCAALQIAKDCAEMRQQMGR